jgi:hypothetical protein
MPRYIVQRTFPEVLHIPIANGGADRCRGLTERNARSAHLDALLRQRGRGQDVLRLRRVDPEGDPQDAHRHALSDDRITHLRVPDPYFYA